MILDKSHLRLYVDLPPSHTIHIYIISYDVIISYSNIMGGGYTTLLPSHSTQLSLWLVLHLFFFFLDGNDEEIIKVCIVANCPGMSRTV